MTICVRVRADGTDGSELLRTEYQAAVQLCYILFFLMCVFQNIDSFYTYGVRDNFIETAILLLCTSIYFYLLPSTSIYSLLTLETA